uniref:CD80-like immunoglobulin C2-set domain-containing protein n=1 Tax=Fundulus heteroclitus TaxID=8078 RepID=A0A3Q2NZA8_FUNHE
KCYKPVLTPSTLVVKYGDPASTRCVACQQACLPVNETIIAVEASVGKTTKDGTTLTWTVDRLTQWDLTPKCFYTDVNNHQCLTHLPVIVYQPPENVSISLNHTGPLTEHTEYILQCSVLNVAPAGNLVVTFYRGQTQLGQKRATSTSKKPVNESFTLSFNASKEDNGAQFWCEAKLELGADGPQPPPVVKSDSLTATVHCKFKPLFLFIVMISTANENMAFWIIIYNRPIDNIFIIEITAQVTFNVNVKGELSHGEFPKFETFLGNELHYFFSSITTAVTVWVF